MHLLQKGVVVAASLEALNGRAGNGARDHVSVRLGDDRGMTGDAWCGCTAVL